MLIRFERSIRPPFIAALLATLVLAVFAIAENRLMTIPVPTTQLASVLPGAVVALTNEEREDAGIASLKASALLARAAQLKADDMAAKSYYAHVSPDGNPPPYWLSAVGYKYQIMAENLVIDRETSDDVVSAWMGSKYHRENILNPVFTEIGIGVAYGTYKGRDTIYVVQMFAKPQGTPAPAPKPVATPAPAPKPATPAPAPAPAPKPVVTEPIVRAPEPKPVIKDRVAPVLDAIASTTLVEVPSIIATTTIIAPALATEIEIPVELPAAPQPQRPALGVRISNFANGVIADIKSFFSF